MIIPIFIPHKGCPYDCIYCNQKIISGQREEVDVGKMRSILEAHLSTAQAGASVQIGFYGGSFTGVDRKLQLDFLRLAEEYYHRHKIDGIRLSTRPDYISREILDYLKAYPVKTIELGVQSLDPEVLAACRRGHSARDVQDASRLIKEYGFELGIQTLVGLPESNAEKELETARKVVELGPGIVRIYPALVIKGTVLEKMYDSGKYRPLRLEEAVELCGKLLEIYEKNDINVIRIGLQPTENLHAQGDVTAGPFHPAFRQLVEARLALRRIEDAVARGGLQEKEDITIYTGKRNLSNVIGQKKENILYLKEKYKYVHINVVPCETLRRHILVE